MTRVRSRISHYGNECGISNFLVDLHAYIIGQQLNEFILTHMTGVVDLKGDCYAFD